MPVESPLAKKWAVAFALLPLLLLSFMVWSFDSLPFLDLPNHLTRSYIIANIDRPEYAKNFYYAPCFVPYILGDLMFAELLRIFPPYAAARIWMIILLLAFPASVLVLARVRGVRSADPVLYLCLSYLATSFFYVSAFHSFLLSIVIVFLGAAAWERWCESRGLIPFCLFILLTVLSYLSHLAGLFFLGVWIGALSLRRFAWGRLSFGALLLSAAPFLALIATHALGHQLGSSASDGFVFRTPFVKLATFGAMFIRYSFELDVPLGVLFIGLLIGLMTAGRRAQNQERIESRKEWLYLGVVFTAAFLVLPYSVGPAMGIDFRALPYMSVCLLLLALESAPAHVRNGAAALATAGMLAFLNCAYLFYHWRADDRRLAQLHEAISAVPAHGVLLPINTWKYTGRMDHGLHHGELYMIDSPGGLAPEVFANSSAPNQFPYFTYRRPFYSPGEFWYSREEDSTVNWDLIRSSYTFALITKPFDPARIKLGPTQRLFENDAAVVLRIN